mmetsp:Transcript_16924/g.34727  ORF Transcript_16924/g.34727 Transcript_16924/m.34727 type:complete len:239 (-) Transcript_16924:116-832(-)
MTPVTLSVNISQIQCLVNTLRDTGDRGGNFSCHERSTTTRRLVVEQDSVRQMHSVSLAVVHEDPERVLLRHSIWRPRVERSGFRLGHLLDLSVQLTCRRLVKADRLLHSTCANCVQHAQDADAVTISCVLGHVKRNLDVTHSTKVVNLSRTNLRYDGDEVGCVAKIAIVKEQLHTSVVAVFVNVVNATGVEGGGATNDAMHGVAFVEEQFREVASILASDAGDESDLFLCFRHIGRRR